MQMFLIIVAAMFVGGILFLLFLYFGIKFLIRRFLTKIVAALEQFAGQGVPPFRITLHKANKVDWKDAMVVNAASDALTELGYELIGDFLSPELPTVRLRAFVNPMTSTYGVLSKLGDVGPLLDIACDFTDGDHATVSTAPQTGLDRPDFSRLVRIEADLKTDAAGAVAAAHERMLAEQKGKKPVLATPGDFPKVFCRAHAREMDWRIARGGVTPDEVRRNCQVTGADPPSDEAVDAVVQQWRRAISEFIDEELREKFLKYVTQMSAAEWEEVRDRLYFVHERSDRDQVISTLAEQMEMRAAGTGLLDGDSSDDDDEDDEDEDDAVHEVVYARIRPLFDGAPVRDAFVKAQTLLPEGRRFRRVASIKSPYGADVYVEPEMADAIGD